MTQCSFKLLALFVCICVGEFVAKRVFFSADM